MRDGWRARQRRAQAHRWLAENTLRPRLPFLAEPRLPARVLLTRVAKRQLDDDNLRGAMKAVRDGVAAALGIDDADPRVTWLYDQKAGPPQTYAVEIVVTRGAPPT